ncbi:hypothetical protein [Burkholderia glumae]|uniref:Uncharacterized protein n=1 Tax=Burkholderia glumae TaxID=337 RepID=A0AAP9Y4S1_BURGL|nr:hypothetical protein [Burkholderia glumae]AJY66763.1 hypothetical protein KS03_3060 [Burkholderia glumae LMG 2196 = ATCC 33617]MCM2482944.1 hypothetical protein [Burkholderia glumae]MCM2506260.1 hypothetical protein [Burkholderia glumae]MCM2537846.1 hypothetical protein [Burkholderia glumae]QHE09347.1 hypothetical protein GQR88_02370 [Burkholderia glumae AU6208]
MRAALSSLSQTLDVAVRMAAAPGAQARRALSFLSHPPPAYFSRRDAKGRSTRLRARGCKTPARNWRWQKR